MPELLTFDELLALVHEILRQTAQEARGQKDSQTLVELLGKQDVRLAKDVYTKLQVELYWKRKDLPATVIMSRAGIQHALSAARKSADPAQSRGLRDVAKALAYNLASFTWPGWDEKGIVITSSDLPVGLEAARLNLRLAEGLDKPQKGKANAFWAIGAHQLAAGEYPAAIDAFKQGQSHANQANDAALERMLEGYARMASLLANPHDEQARSEFDAIVAALKQMDSEDAREFAKQLPIALAVFEGQPKG